MVSGGPSGRYSTVYGVVMDQFLLVSHGEWLESGEEGEGGKWEDGVLVERKGEGKSEEREGEGDLKINCKKFKTQDVLKYF